MGKKQPDTTELEAAEVGGIETAADDFAPVAGTLRGDVRDCMLNVIRNATDWAKFDERRQRDINAAVDNAATVMVQKAVAAIAAEGRSVVPCKLDSLSVKDGIKVQCSAGFSHDALVLLGEAQGKQVQLTVADPSAFDDQRAPAEVTPDQPDLIPDDDSDLVNAADPDGEAAFGEYGEGQGDSEAEDEMETA